MKTTRKQIVALIAAGVLGILAALSATACFSILKMQGESMEPSIEKGERILINRMAYCFQKPRTGDAVAFPCNVYSEDGEGSILIRRIAASEGDRVEIKDGMFYVNGKLCKEYASSPVYMEPMEETVIEEHKVFVLSDNRGALLDSRDQAVGQLDTSELLGKVCFK